MDYNAKNKIELEKPTSFSKDSVPMNPELAKIQNDVVDKRISVEESVLSGIQKLRTEISFLINTFKLPKEQEDFYFQILKVTD